MRHFLFHFHEANRINIDDEGEFLIDAVAAIKAAHNAARQMMAEDVVAGHLCLSCHIEVVDREASESVIVRFADAIKLSGLP